MPAIVLTTFNARFSHPSMGLRCLLANLDVWRDQTRLIEFDLETRPEAAVETILAENPRLIGCGVYVWNTELVHRFATLLKILRPEVHLILGGPEAAHALDHHPLATIADHRVAGEGERIFAEICHTLLTHGAPLPKKIIAPPADLTTLRHPYDAYTSHDLAHRHLYVESSRGCPYRCAFCLSALDPEVRRFPLDPFLKAMADLLERGGRHFKFVDRTFNLGEAHATAILDFFLARIPEFPGIFLHFEMVPDRLTPGLKTRLAAFPAGTLQLELGIQSFDPAVLQTIDRHMDQTRAEENLRWLLTATQAHLHTDLIIGLPGEDLASFAQGFDRLFALGPHEIQVGILKQLAGTPLTALTGTEEMHFDPEPPYELLANRRIDFMTLRRLKRFARYWDLVGNSGRFPNTLRQAFRERSPFYTFLAFSDWLYATTGQTHQIALPRLTRLVQEGFGAQRTPAERSQLDQALEQDLQHQQRTEKKTDHHPPSRQMRHRP
ncbi:MAG: B12-binding domain-containing radical SAM protein [Magnetococcales bacterium]|nr:B12-binding domain-containing radical SAM protein [Magnetococcales bacterium]